MSVDIEPAATRERGEAVEAFTVALERHGLVLQRERINTLQVNLGLLCNQSCRHCHLEAGPGRREVMSRQTMDEVIAFARRHRFPTIDLTGGAPELIPDLSALVEELCPLTSKLILRSNLTALEEKQQEPFLDLCREFKVALVASFPSTSANQADAQRGSGVWEKSIAALRDLNSRGYGEPGSGLELNLVANPAGAYIPAGQCQLEKKFKADLERRWGIVFNSLFSFANVPLGRFRSWLVRSGNYEQYMKKLTGKFNPKTIPGLMCRTLLSVSWDGYLYDCDFNQAAGLPCGGRRIHLSDPAGPPEAGAPIAVGDHCYACTACSGFT